MKNIFTISLLFFITLVCKGQSLFDDLNTDNINKEEIIAEVGNIKITAEEFFYGYEFGPAFVKRIPDSKETYLKYLINEKLMALEGYEQEIFNNSETSGVLDEFKSDLATEEMFKDEILSKVRISESEIDTVLNSKLIELEIKWLYSSDQSGISNYLSSLRNGVNFDSLFLSQINDSVYLDMRMMNVTAFDLLKKNRLLYQIVDTLKAGDVSAPIHTDDGWYIVKLNNISKNMITSETEHTKLKFESEQAVKKYKMDLLSDLYVDSLMRNEKLVIKRDAFNILRSYLGKFILPDDTYDDWDLENKLETALNNLGLSKEDEYPGIDLLTGANSNYKIEEFIVWFRNRENYLKFNKVDLTNFSRSLENYVWRMVRDRLLTSAAGVKGYFENEWVVRQSNWWKEKIAYSAMKNKLTESVILENKEINFSGENNETQKEKLSAELTEKIFRKITELKKKFPVNINEKILNQVNVSQINDKKAIEFYAVKNSGLIPRPAFPSIDHDWGNWQ